MNYGTARILESTQGMPREVWLDRRKLGIGASEVPAILGLDRYAGPWTVAARKLGLVGESEDTPATRWGRHLEPLVISESAIVLGCEVQPVPWTLGPADPASHLRVSLDAWVPSQAVPLEAKAPYRVFDRAGWDSLEEDGVPAEGTSAEGYWYQLQAQIYTTGAPCGILSKMQHGKLTLVEIEANPAVHEVIVENVEKVWDAVEQVRREPGLLDHFRNGGIIAPNAADLGEFQSGVKVGKEVAELTDFGLSARIEEFRSLKAQVAVIETRLDTLKAELLAVLTSQGLERGIVGPYELKLRTMSRQSGEYRPDAPTALVKELADHEKQMQALKSKLKEFGIINRSLWVEAKLRSAK